MTTIPLLAARAPTVRGVRPILYVRALIALATIGSWLVSAVSGLVLWLSPHGPGTRYLPTALDLTRSNWIDVHVVASFLAVSLTLIHLTVMRSGVRAYLRLVFLGRGSSGGGRRRLKPVLVVRALLVTTMVLAIPIVAASGLIPWLAPDVRRAGQQLLLFAFTQREWTDIHTAVSMFAMAIAVTHVTLVRFGLYSDLRLLATGQRSAPRRSSNPPADSA
jgi:Domain of unknown function (DUF4405)